LESIYSFSQTQLLAFSLILHRIVSFIVSMPVIGTNNVAVQVKVLFSLAVCFVLAPVISKEGFDANLEGWAFMVLAVKEIFVGLMMGFMARLFFMSLSMAGQLISVSLGVSQTQLFNPAFEENSSAIDQFFLILATLFFFGLNGHHLFLKGIVESYQLVPLAQNGISLVGLSDVGQIGQVATSMALKFSAPILVTILFTNAAMGIVGRAVPQINILITSLPVNTLVGLLVLFLSLPLIVWGMDHLMSDTVAYLFGMLKTL